MACPNATLPVNYSSPTSCKIHHPLLQDIVALDSLKTKNDVLVTSPSNKAEQYYIQPCGNTKHCKGAVCIENLSTKKVFSMGSLASSSYDFALDELRVKYEGGDPCPERDGVYYSAEVRYHCDQHARNVTKPVFVAKLACHTFFTWTTRAICKGYMASTLHTNAHLPAHKNNASSLWSKCANEV